MTLREQVHNVNQDKLIDLEIWFDNTLLTSFDCHVDETP